MTAAEYFGEVPFRRYVSDLDLMKDILVLLSYHTAGRARELGIAWDTAVLRVVYANGERLEWSIPVSASKGRHTVFMKTAPMLYMVPRHPVRVLALGLRSSGGNRSVQTTFGEPADRRDRAGDGSYRKVLDRYAMVLPEAPDLSDISEVRRLADVMRAWKSVHR